MLDRLPRRTSIVLTGNKADLIASDTLLPRLDLYAAMLRYEVQVMGISALHNEHLADLLSLLLSLSPIRPAEYEEEQITDRYEREIAADLIRESALVKLRDEVPHGIAVRVDEFQERDNGMTYIAATVFVERESQKGIVIGEGGKMLKQIGTRARQEIETMGGHKVFLE